MGRLVQFSGKAVDQMRKLRSSRLFAAGLIALSCATGLTAQSTQSRAAQINAQFGISIAGIPVGKGSVKASVNGRHYAIDGSAMTSGVSKLFVDSKGRAVSKGKLHGDKVLPSMYALNSREQKIHNVVQIAMRSGNVSDFSASPPLIKARDRVPLRRVHTRGIVDPLSALLMSVKSTKHRLGKTVCNQTIRMFDGRWRYNIELFYKGMTEVKSSSSQGYSGPATRCGARMRFVAGHRPGNKSTKFMESNKDLEVWFVPVANEPVVAAYRLQIGTVVGRLVLQARDLQIN